DIAGVLFERVVDLPVDGLRRDVREVVVAGAHGEVTGDLVGRAGVLLVQVLDRASYLPKLVLEPRAEILRVDLRAHVPTLIGRACARPPPCRCPAARRSCPGSTRRKRASGSCPASRGARRAVAGRRRSLCPPRAKRLRAPSTPRRAGRRSRSSAPLGIRAGASGSRERPRAQYRFQAASARGSVSASSTAS